MRHLVKKAAEIFGWHIYTSGDFFQCKRKIIGRFHKFQCLLQLQNPFVASVFLIRCVFTETFTEESAEKLIHGAENYKLIPLFLEAAASKSVQSVRWIVLQISDSASGRKPHDLWSGEEDDSRNPSCSSAYSYRTPDIRIRNHREYRNDRTGWDENTVSCFCKKFNFINVTVRDPLRMRISSNSTCQWKDMTYCGWEAVTW